MLWILETGLKSGVENDLLASGFKELVCTTPAKIPRGFVILNDGPMGINYPSFFHKSANATQYHLISKKTSSRVIPHDLLQN